MIKIILMLVFTVVALLLIVVGVGFFISSLYFYLLTAFHNPALATFFCGLSLLIIAILLLLIVILLKSSLFKFKAPKKVAAKVQEKVKAITDDPCGEALHIVQEYPFRSSLVAVGAGFLLGFFPQLRNSLIDSVVTYLKTGSVADSLKSMKSDEE